MMKQESSAEKNPLSTESSSDEYDIYKVLKDLEGIGDLGWDTVDDFDKELINWTDRQFFEQSEFQNKYYVVQSQVTPYRQLRQAMMEVQARLNALQKTTISYKRCINDLARVRHEMEIEEDPFYKKDKEFEIELLLVDKQVWMNKIRQCKREIEGLLKIIKERTDTNDISKVTEFLEDRSIFEAEEHKYWIARMAKQSAMDLMVSGRIDSGNLDSILMMNPEDQAAVADLALTYSTALNRSIGAIKQAAEERVDTMMEGNGPAMFDTAGVLEDYAKNNIEGRSLQSSDQPQTES